MRFIIHDRRVGLKIKSQYFPGRRIDFANNRVDRSVRNLYGQNYNTRCCLEEPFRRYHDHRVCVYRTSYAHTHTHVK